MKLKKKLFTILSLMLAALAISCSTKEGTSANALTKSESVKESSKKGSSKKETSSEDDLEDEEESSIKNLLYIGDTGITYKGIISSTDKISKEKVYVTLNDIYRGDEAKKIVDEFNKNNSTSAVADLVSDSLEYIVINYTLKLNNDSKPTKNGQTSNLKFEVLDSKGNAIKTYGTSYIMRSALLNVTENLQPGDSGETTIVVTLPKTVNNFIIKLGDYEEDMAYFFIK